MLQPHHHLNTNEKVAANILVSELFLFLSLLFYFLNVSFIVGWGFDDLTLELFMKTRVGIGFL